MKKRTKKLVLMVVALLALVGAYFATLDVRPAAEWYAEAEIELPRLIAQEDEDVRVVAMHMDNGYDIRLARDEESGLWQFTEYQGIRLNQITVLTAAFSVLDLPYHGYISPEQVLGLDVYGLLDGASRVTVDFSDGRREVLYVGSQTPDGRFHYAKLEGMDSVHLIDVRAGRRMFYNHNNFLDRDLPPINLVALDEIRFRLQDDEFIFIPGPPTGVEHFAWMRDEFVSHGAGLGMRLDMNFTFGAVFNPLNGLAINGVIIDADVNTDLAHFGLLEPSLMMHLTDVDGNVLHFYAGYENEDGNRYFMISGEPFVFTVPARILNDIEDVDKTRLFQRRVSDVIVAQADTVRVRGQGQNTTLRPNSVDADASAYRRIFEMRWDSYIDPIDVSAKPVAWTLEIEGHVLEDNIFPRQLEYVTDGYFTVQPDGSIRYELTFTFHVFDELFYAISRDGAYSVSVISRNMVDRTLGGV